MNILRTVFVACLVYLIAAAQAQSADLAAEKVKLAKLETAYGLCKKKYSAKKTDVKLKKAYLDATLAFANGVMYTPVYKSTVKYPKALRLYREVLTLDPKNKVATESRDTIESIYRSMGKPIPD